VGFVVKKELRVEVVFEGEDVMGIHIEGKYGKILVACVYQRCEGLDVEGNQRRFEVLEREMKKCTEEGGMYIVGGDFNAHILELDGEENRNGRRMKKMVAQTEGEILNIVWPGMDGWTWERGESHFTLDYIVVNERVLRMIMEAWIWGQEELVDSDHKSVGICMGWRGVKKRRNCKKN
jgi:exonuclease III